MPPLEEPTVAEMIRALGSKLDHQAMTLGRLESAVNQYVTQEQRNADTALATVRAERQNERITALEERRTFLLRLAAGSIASPIIVGIVVWLLTKGTG